MIIFLDDYHNIHTKKVPTDLQKTKVAHMASSMVDVHPQIPAIKRTSVNKFVLLRFTFLQICFTKASVREVISTNTAKDGLKKL